jgi:phosphoribosylglycinamide formyltransferase-1
MRKDARVSAFRIVVLASGGGTNLQAILDQLHGGEEGIEVVGVGSDQPDAKALERAREAGVETAVFPADGYEDRAARDAALGDWIEERGADLVVLAGYMQLLSPEFVGRFRNRVINVHPALLPSFPGIDAVQQAIDHGSKVTGVTVHFVDEGVDSGPIIMQRPVTIPSNRDWDETEALIHATEHALLPEAIRLIAAGRIRLDERNPRLVHVDPPACS